MSLAPRCEAIVVGNVPNVVPNTTTAPSDDPGWNNSSTVGKYVYLGDGWVLSARHVGYSPAQGMEFQTPSGPATFHRIPGTYYLDYGFDWGGLHHYAVSNPTSVTAEGGQSVTLSPYTDLQLFRVHGDVDPGLPSLKIATQHLPNQNVTGNTAPQLLAIAPGQGRATAETHWNTSGSSPNIIWTETTGPGNHQGYGGDGVVTKRWGTNRAADPVHSSNVYSSILSNTAAVLPLASGVGDISRDVISLSTVYNKQGDAGATSHEMQAIPGDSGGAVFYKRGLQWELAGILNAQITYEGQPGGTAMYGNATSIAALSYYNQNYSNSIRDIIASHPDYSIMGDVNLDGIVSGNGTGPSEADDVSAFVSGVGPNGIGWGYNNGSGVGTVTSWKNGDLNRDGRTNVEDFLLLRGALNGQVSSAVVTALFGSGGLTVPSLVPEPSAILLAMLAAGMFCLGRRPAR